MPDGKTTPGDLLANSWLFDAHPQRAPAMGEAPLQFGFLIGGLGDFTLHAGGGLPRWDGFACFGKIEKPREFRRPHALIGGPEFRLPPWEGFGKA